MKIVKIIAKILAYLVLAFFSTFVIAGLKLLVLQPGNILSDFKRAGYEPKNVYSSIKQAFRLGWSYADIRKKDAIEGYKWYFNGMKS